MLRKNNFIIVLLVLLCVMGFSSCCSGPMPPSAFYTVEILPKEGDFVQSEIIKLSENMTKNYEPWIFLYNVSCSLRNEENKEEIVATDITDTWYTEATFCFTIKNGKDNAKNAVYFDNESKHYEECYARENDTSKYFIIINDPDLDGYDPNYETVIRYCYNSLANVPVYLGANTSK